QIRRSASSIPASIAEGTGPGTEPELARFCRIATGSLNELEYHLLLCRHLSYLPADAYEPLSLRLSALRRMLTKFIQSLS
ncbi:MAG: four helix bundle protein, partial [Gemmatimonadota bacterium]